MVTAMSIRQAWQTWHGKWLGHARAAFVLLHVLAMLVLALPDASRLGDRAVWKARGTQLDFKQWAERLQGLGFDTDAKRFERWLWDLSQGYLKLRAVLVAPFDPYRRVAGMTQSWRMFSNPQRRPARLHIDVKDGGQWRPLYVGRSDEFEWRREQFDNNRVRKLIGRFARNIRRGNYRLLARWVARQAAHDYPAASEIRVRLYRFKSLPPEAIAAGERPQGKFADVETLKLEEFR